MSLKKHLILSFWIPPYIITGYQTVFAEGIYTLEYLKDSGHCSYNKEDQWVTGTCSVTFSNHGTKDVPFSVSIRSQFKDTEFLQDLDAIGEEKLIIKPQENKTFAINFKKVASDSNIPVSSSLSSFDISIKDGTRQRLL
ncbi:hypothetical protein LJR153_003458 [Paenibacillus sp. LjRoot153]|uniref:hypothetical protein n=1 Tax=Paenibacillus sp. LjRoot153 TaxID=3342270 RepID=UPI003ED12A4D